MCSDFIYLLLFDTVLYESAEGKHSTRRRSRRSSSFVFIDFLSSSNDTINAYGIQIIYM